MRDLGFTLCRAYGNVWMRVAVNTSDLGATADDGMPAGESYYEYLLLNVDRIMVDSRR